MSESAPINNPLVVLVRKPDEISNLPKGLLVPIPILPEKKVVNAVEVATPVENK